MAELPSLLTFSSLSKSFRRPGCLMDFPNSYLYMQMDLYIAMKYCSLFLNTLYIMNAVYLFISERARPGLHACIF